MSAYHPLPDFVGFAVPLKIAEFQRYGGQPTSWEVDDAKKRWFDMMEGIGENTEGGAELLYFIKPGMSANAMGLLIRVLAIMAFEPGGITFCGNHFEAKREDVQQVPAGEAAE